MLFLRTNRKISKDIALYEPIGTDKEGNQIMLVDIMESGEAELWERVVLKRDVGQLYALIPRVLSRREQYIICRRYGLYNTRPCTQKEIARRIGISRSYVSRIEKKALAKLKRAFLEH